jgi:hypothetical protein
VYTRTPGETVHGGPYTIRAVLNPSRVLSNYVITYHTANFTITPATPTVTVSDAGGTYNGSAFPATGTVRGVNGAPTGTLEGVGLSFTYYLGSTSGTNLGPSAPSRPGTYTVVAIFAGSADYNRASAQTTFTIRQPATTVANPPPVIHTTPPVGPVGLPGQITPACGTGAPPVVVSTCGTGTSDTTDPSTVPDPTIGTDTTTDSGQLDYNTYWSLVQSYEQQLENGDALTSPDTTDYSTYWADVAAQQVAEQDVGVTLPSVTQDYNDYCA